MHIVSSSVWRKVYYQDIVCFPIDILSWFVVKPSGESNHVWSEPSDRWCPSDDVGLHRLRFRFRPRADLIFDHCDADRWPTSSSDRKLTNIFFWYWTSFNQHVHIMSNRPTINIFYFSDILQLSFFLRKSPLPWNVLENLMTVCCFCSDLILNHTAFAKYSIGPLGESGV